MSTKHGTWGMNYSPTFMRLAEAAADRAKSDMGNPRRGKCVGRDGAVLTHSEHAAEAVIMSVAALEAGINEIVVWHQLGFGGAIPPLPDDFMDQRLTDKWALVPRVIGGKEFDRGAAPWQDFSALVGLRDRLVHFKWYHDKVPSFMRTLQAKDLIIPEDPAVSWVDAALTDRIAVWAVETTIRMFNKIAELMGRMNDDSWTWPRIIAPGTSP